MIGKILCFFRRHKLERIDKTMGPAGGCRCIRKGCDFKIDPIKWPPVYPPKN